MSRRDGEFEELFHGVGVFGVGVGVVGGEDEVVVTGPVHGVSGRLLVGVDGDVALAFECTRWGPSRCNPRSNCASTRNARPCARAEGYPAGVSFKETDPELGEALERRRLHTCRGRRTSARWDGRRRGPWSRPCPARGGIARPWPEEITAEALVEDHGHVQVLAYGPEGVVDVVVPVAVEHGVGAGEYALEGKVFAGALDLGYSVLHIFQQDHGRTE